MDWKNRLYFGDNLDILRREVPDACVDLIYLDPPFNSNATYNVLFKEKSGEESAAQITAFEDTWQWSMEAEAVYKEIVTSGAHKLADLMQALLAFLGRNDMMAYLVMMAVRLVELHRVLKPTGSIYLHCDPTASHYLKLVLDAIFGHGRFLNEVAWKRSSAHSDTKQGMKRCGRIHDVLFIYSKSENYTWHPIYTPYTKEYLESEYRHVSQDGRRYKETDLTAAKPGGDVKYKWRVKRLMAKGRRWEADLTDEYVRPRKGLEYKAVSPYGGRFWAYSKQNLVEFARNGHLIHRSTGMPRLVQYADEMPGIPVQDLWSDISPAMGAEDLGYPTQKPNALLERIVNLSSNEGDLVVDPFCGCGTAIAAAEGLKRQWIGIDITYLAINLVQRRLRDSFAEQLSPYEIIGAPTDLKSAEALKEISPHQFEWWAVDLVNARPAKDHKKGADTGIDGYINFFDDKSGQAKQVIVQVKSGYIHVNHVRDLKGVLDREKAAIGALITLREPTKPMLTEAAATGFYESKDFPGRYPRLQILTIGELLAGKKLEYPTHRVETFAKAGRKTKTEQEEMF
ncbi:MAG: DNA methyltransferase [Terriglobia bacterium]|jgi:DNA modification methylase